ncbi:MAG: sigma-70 family RNA polymerase sigma factor [Lewinellaceae bacterium]|nr:sigma-70 family RNA polymerase sigma factor [Lewinellaceae bacterium]
MIRTVDEADKTLLEGIKSADREQVQRFYDEYMPGIIQFVVSHKGTEDDARDVFQDAVYFLFRKMRSGELVLTASLRTYLLAVCRNIWRTRLRDSRELRLQPGEGESAADESPDIDELIFRAGRDRLYREHFSRLGDQCRRILELFFAKVRLSEIAEMLNLTEKYVKKRKFTCKETLVASIRQDPRFEELRN